MPSARDEISASDNEAEIRLDSLCQYRWDLERGSADGLRHSDPPGVDRLRIAKYALRRYLDWRPAALARRRTVQ